MGTVRTFRSRGQKLSVEERCTEALRIAARNVVFGAMWLEEMVEKSRSRRLLQELSDHQLKDIGISRADAFEEGRRSFWD